MSTEFKHDTPQSNAIENVGQEMVTSSDGDSRNVTSRDERCKNIAPPSPFAMSHKNICSAAAGAKVLFATDDWFARAENLLNDGPPIFIDDLYCEQGKVMDGWETRRYVCFDNQEAKKKWGG